jgi:thioredoxin 1
MAASKTGARLLKDQQEFDDLVLGDAKTPVMCFFTAPWCGPCRLSIPVVKESMKQFEKKISVYEICTDDAPDIAEGCGVLSIPTIQVYCKGELKETIVGCVAKSVLASAIEKVLEDTSKLFAVNGNADRQ